MLIQAEYLVNGVSVVQARRVKRVDYVHIELDSHDVIFAEGALFETFVGDQSRGMFHNAATFASLYTQTVSDEPVYRAQRAEHGAVLKAVRRRLAERAGCATQDQSGGQPCFVVGSLAAAGASYEAHGEAGVEQARRVLEHGLDAAAEGPAVRELGVRRL